MNKPIRETKRSRVRLLHLAPNMLTLAAICAGLTAIRFGYEGNFEFAVQLVLLACILDGLDGRLARMLKNETALGAELDSLADFVNFGVAPVLLLHSWALQDWRNIGWIAVLFYAVCCVLRLARFNVANRSESDDFNRDFFVGVPSPAGAVLVLLPMVVSFGFSDLPLAPPAIVAIHICLIALLMISRIPTYSFKRAAIDRGNTLYALLGAAIVTACLLSYFWGTLAVLSALYIGCLILAYRKAKAAN